MSISKQGEPIAYIEHKRMQNKCEHFREMAWVRYQEILKLRTRLALAYFVIVIAIIILILERYA